MTRYGYGDGRDHGRDYHDQDRDYRQPRYEQPGRRADYQTHDDRGGRQPVGYQPVYDNRPPYNQPPPPAKKRRWPLWIALGVVGVVLVSCVAAIANSGSDSGPGSTLSSGATTQD